MKRCSLQPRGRRFHAAAMEFARARFQRLQGCRQDDAQATVFGAKPVRGVLAIQCVSDILYPADSSVGIEGRVPQNFSINLVAAWQNTAVYLSCLGGPPRWICAVAKRENGEGFLVTAYPTDARKIGEVVWKK